MTHDITMVWPDDYPDMVNAEGDLLVYRMPDDSVLYAKLDGAWFALWGELPYGAMAARQINDTFLIGELEKGATLVPMYAPG